MGQKASYSAQRRGVSLAALSLLNVWRRSWNRTLMSRRLAMVLEQKGDVRRL